MMCCGKERQTAFCSECGLPVEAKPLDELLSWIKHRADDCEQRLLIESSLSRMLVIDGFKFAANSVRDSEILKKDATQWRIWAKALEDIINA